MTHCLLPFKYENDKQKSNITGFGGLPVYLDLAQASGLSKSIDRHLKASSNSQGWTDSQVVMSLMSLNLSVGDCVEDLNRLESDEGLCRIIKRAQKHGMSRQQRRVFLRRWRKGQQRTVPSSSAVFRYLSAFHNHEQELVLHTEFSDGNVPAGFDQLRVFKEALKRLPEGIKEVRLRSDTAGYQHKLLKYCAMGQNKRFGKIEFAIGSDVTPEFKKGVSETPDSD